MFRTFRASVPRQLRVIFLACLMVAAGLWTMTRPNLLLPAKLLLFFCTLFFVGALVRAVYVLVKGAERLEITPEGITVAAWARQVPWTQIDRIASRQIGQQKFVSFYLKEGALAGQNRPLLHRLVSRANGKLGYGELTVATNFYAEPHDAIFLAISDAFAAAGVSR